MATSGRSDTIVLSILMESTTRSISIDEMSTQIKLANAISNIFRKSIESDDQGTQQGSDHSKRNQITKSQENGRDSWPEGCETRW